MEIELPSAHIISEVGELLRVPLPRAQEDLEAHVIGLEALRYDLAEATSNSLQMLYQKRKQMLWPKDAEKNLTELDRTTRLNGDVAILERDYQFLSRLEALVDSRLSLALLFLT
jgi:hypothetical protein